MTKSKSNQNISDQEGKDQNNIIDDIPKTGFRKNLRRDFREIFHFYIDSEKREQLTKAGWLKKWLLTDWWFFKSVINKLPKFRRFLFFAGVFLFLAGFSVSSWNTVFLKLSFFIMFFIILLELKDKFLAQNELAAGREIQSALMPDKNPVFTGWDIWLFNSAAKEVSGDLIDYINISENKLGVALGDVAGKGLGAALLMARLQASLTALAPITKSLPELGKQLNRIFCRDCLPSKFASFIYIELKSESSEIKMFNAGHHPPLLLKKGKLEEMPKGQPALGLTSASVYEEQSAILDPGDFLLAYSDGITEARNEDGDLYGENRLNDLLLQLNGSSATAVGNRVMVDVEKFIGSTRQSDDISIIVLKRNN